MSQVGKSEVRAADVTELTTPFGSTVTSYYSCFVSFLVLNDFIAPRGRAVIGSLEVVYSKRKGGDGNGRSWVYKGVMGE